MCGREKVCLCTNKRKRQAPSGNRRNSTHIDRHFWLSVSLTFNIRSGCSSVIVFNIFFWFVRLFYGDQVAGREGCRWDNELGADMTNKANKKREKFLDNKHARTHASTFAHHNSGNNNNNSQWICTHSFGAQQMTKLQNRQSTRGWKRANMRAEPNFWQPPQNLMNLKLFNQWIVMAGNYFKSCISFSVQILNHSLIHSYTLTNEHTNYCLSACPTLTSRLFIYFSLKIFSTIFFFDFTWADACFRTIHMNHNLEQMESGKIATCWIISVLHYWVKRLRYQCDWAINVDFFECFFKIHFALKATGLCTATVDETSEQQQNRIQ